MTEPNAPEDRTIITSDADTKPAAQTTHHASTRKAKTSPMNSQNLVLFTVLGLVLLTFIFLAFRRLAPAGTDDNTAGASNAQNINVSGQPMAGDESAPVTLVTFEDFKCPACKQFDETVLPELMSKYVDTGKAKIYFVNFPFIGLDSTTAAIASECVYNQNATAFWDYKTYVFRAQGPENQQWATPELLAGIARDNVPDVDADELQTCIEDRTYAKGVDADRAEGEKLVVQSTPSVFVNGVLQASPDLNTISSAIEQAQ